MRRPGELPRSLERYLPYTMVPKASLADLVQQVEAVLRLGIPGNLVECGVWRGGAGLMMADVLRRAGVQDRKVWLFDSFEGLPPPQEVDGSRAQEYAAHTDDPRYYDNCRAAVEEVRSLADRFGLSDHLEIVPGWFADTIPPARVDLGTIALLRLDCDWYDSVRLCLDQLYDDVADHGFVLLDDYHFFEGCAVAVHEFLGQRRLSHRLESLLVRGRDFEAYQVAMFRKGEKTWLQTKQELFPPLRRRVMRTLVRHARR